METIVYKNRTRLKRGMILSFDDFPIDKQRLFLLIKQNVLELSSEFNKVYVFGSYAQGTWDDVSDYDVLVEGICSHSIKEEISKRLNIIVDIRTVVKVNKAVFNIVEIP